MAYNLLKGKYGIITGAIDENSIAWQTALKCHEEGAKIVLTNAPIALRMGTLNKLAELTDAVIIPADATSTEDIENLYEKAKEALGVEKIDFLLHSIGMSPNVRKKKHYADLNYDWFQKSIDISALSFHKMMQVGEKMDFFKDGASILGLSYIAAQRSYPNYGDMCQAKAVLESIARSFGQRLGESKGIRVNTISQSPTVTTAGKGIKGFNVFYDYADILSPLGNATAEDCANYCVTMFSDLTKKVTMQNLFHDGGFSASGMTEKLIDKMMSEVEE
ncbi:enoyl-ACP reductase FabI [Sediminitomix flava]|uniref:Enoyl-[acyl-carrier-protein] reductase [NADH] n=1 Tax=Sediminitomix flava TaxID=379075 RepID=A0A315ZFN7_SEDFL|nr:SDR family oxidoreductase [Sediminitomix flava]PWJ43969.1 enoyl-[acyl-carrier-protein] reductase [NADH] [Sediminitomix flava]